MKIKLTLFAIFISFTVFSQAPNWAWAESGGGQSCYDYGRSICTDANGNSYVTGVFQSATIIFDNDTLINVGSFNSGDIFVVKYDPSGNVVWAKSAGGNYIDQSWSISSDGNGNIFVAGFFDSPTMTFGSITLMNVMPGGEDIFLAKYDSNGNVLWARSAGGNTWDQILSTSTDTNGNVIVVGDFESPTITFGSTTLTNTSGSRDIFIAKYDANGNSLWAKSAGGNSGDQCESISTDLNGNSFITGYFTSSSIAFGSNILTNSSGYCNIFIAKYDINGNAIWAQGIIGTQSDIGYGISTTANGDSYITGVFSSPTIAFGSTILTNASSNIDMFAVKYDNNGNVLWAKSSGGYGAERGSSISTDSSGNCFITGCFDSPSVTFGNNTLFQTGPSNTSDVFVVKYDQFGNVLYSKSAGGIGSDYSYGIRSDIYGNSYVTGYFESSQIIFGNDTLTGVAPSVFVAKLNNIFCTGISSVNAGCGSQCNGTAMVYPNGGTPPYTYMWSNLQTTQTISGLCAGTYSVMVIDSLNDTAFSSVTITNNPLPTVSYNQSTTSMCVNWPAQSLTAGTPIGGIYSGTSVTGNSFNPSTAGAGNFTIVYTFTDANGCTNSDSSQITVSLCSGIQTNVENSEFVIFPNPSTGKFTLQSAKNLATTISITNILGELIYQSEILNPNQEIDLSSQPNGIYFVNVLSGSESFTQKITVQK